MMTIVIYPTMRCAFRGGKHCPYCWVDYYEQTTGKMEPLPWQTWRDFLMRMPPAIVDVVGGEPLQWDGLHNLLTTISMRHAWALTTNLLGATEEYRKLLSRPVPNCACITCSVHPFSTQGAQWFKLLNDLRAIYGGRVMTSIVRWPGINVDAVIADMNKLGYPCAVNDYQSPVENIESPSWQRCNGGKTHIVVAPDGRIWPCFALFERTDKESWVLGHIDTWQPATEKRVCKQECGPCYRRSTNPFQIDLEEITDDEAQRLVG